MGSTDIVIAGAGLIGLACALECERRGLSVTIVEKGRAGQEASWAAAGMLAASDPANPASLRALSDLSLSLYPAFLQNIVQSSGLNVPMETEWTLEQARGEEADVAPQGFAKAGFRRIREQSLNPRTLVAAVLSAVKNSKIDLRESTPLRAYKATGGSVEVHAGSERIRCELFVDCTGAWSTAPVRPVKGQMLRVHAPGALAAPGLGNVVVRSNEVYLVPRLDGAVVIGATVEDAGFDKTVSGHDLQMLLQHAARLAPAIGSAQILERWAGLRPGTPDHLPLIGSTGTRTFIAAGHFRNGVLLAPATAYLLADMLLGKTPEMDMQPFLPDRFACTAR